MRARLRRYETARQLGFQSVPPTLSPIEEAAGPIGLPPPEEGARPRVSTPEEGHREFEYELPRLSPLARDIGEGDREQKRDF